MNHVLRHRHSIALNRTIATLAIAAAFIAAGPTLAQMPASQINMSPEQILRSGIQTAPALAPGASAPNAGSSDTSQNGQQLSGTVVAPANAVAVVSTVVSGVVQQVLASTLQKVLPGTPVATLFSQQLMEAQRDYLHLAIQARLAQEKRDRDENLLREGIVALSRVQDTRGAAIQAELAAKERFQALRAAGMSAAAIATMTRTNSLSPQLTLVAGATGTLVELDIHAGQRIEAGMPVAKISTDAALWIELQASRQQAAQIRIGDLFQLKDCGSARVIAISPVVNAANQSTLVRAQSLQNDGCLKVNQFIQASHVGTGPGSGTGGVGVPAAAVIRNGAESFVFVRNPKGFEAVKVQVAPGAAQQAWVSGRLTAGSAVAVKGIIALKGSWLGLGTEAPAAPATPAKPAAKPAATAGAQ